MEVQLELGILSQWGTRAGASDSNYPAINRAVMIHLRDGTRQKGNIMQKTFKHEDIEKILTEADGLINKINSQIIKDMEAEHRIRFETHAQSLKRLRSEVQEKIEKERTSESGTYSEGMHKAIDDIVTAMKNLGSYF